MSRGDVLVFGGAGLVAQRMDGRLDLIEIQAFFRLFPASFQVTGAWVTRSPAVAVFLVDTKICVTVVSGVGHNFEL